MIASNPEYKEQLNSITRLGRALGVTLILAAQRPTGVTDQMRANIKFRIALRVETREESSEILRRPDAAYLPTGLPGRGYLQIGNENIEMVQVAWCGAEYQGGRSVEQPRVSWPDRPNKARASDEEEFPKVFEMMVDEMVALARKISPHQRKPWPDFLPESMALVARVERAYLSDEHFHWMAEGSEQPFIPLSSTIARWMGDEAGWHPVDWENRAMRVPIGLVDNAYNAEQLPLVADLRRGHMVMFGASGWGKTNFLRTLIVSLSALHSPDEMHVYLLDFGGRQLTLFDALPHVGAIITADEPERVQRLIRFLERQLEMRKRTISAAGADDFYSYNQHNRKTPLPALLICIDNFAELRESYEGLLPRLVSLVRDARANGVHFVGTGEMPNSMGGKLFSLFTERLALKLSDASEYTTIVGRGARNLEEVPGRGFTRVGKRALMFQLALASAEIDDNLTESQQLSKLIQRLSDQTTKQPYTKPASIDILTPYVGLSDLLAQPLPQADVPQPVLGIEDIELQPWCLSLAEHGPHLMIIGPPSSGKTTTLQSLALSLAHAYAPSDVMLVLIDLQARLFNYGGRRQLDELPHVVQVIGNEEELPQFVEHLQSLFTSRAAAREQGCPVYVLIDNYDSFSEEAEALRSTGILRTLGKMARTFGSDGLHFVIAGSMGMPRDPLRKQVAASRFGLSMQSAEGAQNLNARIPGSMLRMELPIGRGFCVRAGRPFLLQVAAPFAADDPVPAALDRWIGQISSQRSEPRNRWPEIMTEAPDATELEIEQLQPQSNVAQVRSTINAQQLEALCAELLKHGYPDSILKLMEPNDVIKIAMEHGLMKEAAV